MTRISGHREQVMKFKGTSEIDSWIPDRIGPKQERRWKEDNQAQRPVYLLRS
jgi:hypothetical protein